MEPSKKSKLMEETLDTITENMFGVRRTTSIFHNLCVDCKENADIFKDELSRREFSISGLCQKCQDSVFGGEESD